MQGVSSLWDAVLKARPLKSEDRLPQPTVFVIGENYSCCTRYSAMDSLSLASSETLLYCTRSATIGLE